MDADAHLAVEGHEIDQEMQKVDLPCEFQAFLKPRTRGQPVREILCSKKMMPTRHQLRAVRAPDDQAGYSRARRRRQTSSATSPSELRSNVVLRERVHINPGLHVRESCCASCSRECTVVCFFNSRLRISPIQYPLRNQDVHADCTLCRLLAWSCASLHVDVSACQLLSTAGRKTDAHLGYGAFRNDAPNGGVADDSQHPLSLRRLARSRVDVRSWLAL